MRPQRAHRRGGGAHGGAVLPRPAAARRRLGGERRACRRLCLSSFGRELCFWRRVPRPPSLPRGYLVDDVPENFAAELEELGCVSLHTTRDADPGQGCVRSRTPATGCSATRVDDPARAREIFGWGVDALCTDRIDLIGADFS